MIDKTQSLTIQGLAFSAPAPYETGHVCSDVEAATLNQTLGENLRNNFAKVVKDAKDAQEKTAPGSAMPEDAVEALKAKFAEYAEAYEFQGRRATSTPVDPVERIAVGLAKDKLTAHLKANNIDKKSLAEGRFDSLVQELLTKYPAIREEAKRRHEAAQNIALDSLSDIKAAEPAAA